MKYPRVCEPDDFDQSGGDLDALCARVVMTDIAAQAIEAESGAIQFEEHDWDEECAELGAAVLDALIAHGFIRPEWYGWDDDARAVVVVA